MRFLPGNAQHIGARHSQQDSFGFADPEDREFIEHSGFLAIVCDGMGGMEYGDAASRTAVRAFLDAYQRKTPEETIPDALVRSVHEANDQVLTLAASLGLVEGIGTTLVAIALHAVDPANTSLYFVSVGDSGLFHISNGEMRAINRPHVFANVLDAAVARGTMSHEDAMNHPERESLTSYIGAQRLEEIDRNVDPLPLGEDDVILLASDGLFKTLDAEEMRASCTGHPQKWPEALVERTIAKKREYQDNVTVLSVAMESAQTLAQSPTRAEETLAVPRTVRIPAGQPLSQPLSQPPSQPPPPAAQTEASAWTPPVQAPPSPLPAAQKRPRILVPLIVIVLLILAGAGWWYMRQHRGLQQEVTDPGTAVQAPHRDRLPEFHPDGKDVQAPPLKEPK
ncbi:MAG TPA: protein phosphatase 2C domain-containing protein [Bryobacteraceae bacterium]|nr:protein phosphatase 2C domain-containing protein [Bryobacteraceae bacterium]